MSRALPLLLLAACAPPDAPPADTDVADTEVVDADDVDPLDFVATRFAATPLETAFDLDGDGDLDDALAGLGDVIDPLIADRLASNVHAVVVQLVDVDAWTDDRSVRVGIFPAVDPDTDGTDNASGEEVLDAAGFVGDDLRALRLDGGAIVDGTLHAELAVTDLQVGSFVFSVANGVRLRATGDGHTLTGVVGLAVTTDALAYALGQEGFDPTLTSLLTALADLDLDGDGTPESVSMAFAFDASACRLSIAPVSGG
jgi:hypothetical protein